MILLIGRRHSNVGSLFINRSLSEFITLSSFGFWTTFVRNDWNSWSFRTKIPWQCCWAGGWRTDDPQFLNANSVKFLISNHFSFLFLVSQMASFFCLKYWNIFSGRNIFGGNVIMQLLSSIFFSWWTWDFVWCPLPSLQDLGTTALILTESTEFQIATIDKATEKVGVSRSFRVPSVK